MQLAINNSTLRRMAAQLDAPTADSNAMQACLAVCSPNR
jgi:hypothetical protein